MLDLHFCLFIIVQKIYSDTLSITTHFVLMEGLDKINLLTGRSSAIFLMVLNEIAFVYLPFSGLRVKYDF